MPLQIEQLVSKYRQVSQFPSLSAARILNWDGSQLTAVSSWSQRCLEKGKILKFSQTHLVKGSEIIHTPPIDTSTELLSAFSPSGFSRAVLRELTPPDGGSKKQHLEIWTNNCMSQLVDLTLLDQHGDVYTSGEFSCLEFSPSEKQVLYVAEKKQPKSEPFYPSKTKDNDSTTRDDDKPRKGEEYIYRQDWGETLVGRHHPVLCVCNLENGSVCVPTGVPDDLSVGQALFMKDGFVAVGWTHKPRRLGIVHCTNRLSFIFHLSENGVFTKLSGNDMAAHSPRLYGDILVWLQRPANGPHHACHQLMKLKWGDSPQVLVDIVPFATQNTTSLDFHGLYCHTLPARCFFENKIWLSTPQATTVNSYVINIDSGEMQEVRHEEGSLTVLDVEDSKVLFSLSRVDTPSSLYLGNAHPDVTLTPLLQRASVPPVFENQSMLVLELEAEIKDTVNKFNAIYNGPTKGAPQSVPLIVWPHGGPHTNFVEAYSVFNQFFLSAGFATLQINYRGSTGQGQESVYFLPGKVGDTDVKDCHQAALRALSQYTCLDRKNVMLYGGSHGGFLVTHLSGQYPNFYRAVVAVNPVTSLMELPVSSDIPDWRGLHLCGCSRSQAVRCFRILSCLTFATASGRALKNFAAMAVIEAGFTYYGLEPELSGDDYSKLFKMSPIQYADRMIPPTLLNIGKKDLRVPPSQGIKYYHALNSHNNTVKMNLYDDNHSLSTVPVDMDSTINAVLWFQQHMQ